MCRVCPSVTGPFRQPDVPQGRLPEQVTGAPLSRRRDNVLLWSLLNWLFWLLLSYSLSLIFRVVVTF